MIPAFMQRPFDNRSPSARVPSAAPRRRAGLFAWLHRAAAAALLLVGGAASAHDYLAPWTAALSNGTTGNIIGLDLASVVSSGSYGGLFTVPVPDFPSIVDHNVQHDYQSTKLTGFVFVTSTTSFVLIPVNADYGKLGSPLEKSVGFSFGQLQSVGTSGVIQSVTAMGSHVYAPVPEPSTVLLTMAGVAVIGLRGIKRRALQAT